MNEQQLKTLLETLTIGTESIEVAYDHFDKKVEPPLILFKNTDTSILYGDDKSYFRNKQYIVDLVTYKKDVQLEDSLETIFDNNNIPFSKSEDFIESERVFQIRYFI